MNNCKADVDLVEDTTNKDEAGQKTNQFICKGQNNFKIEVKFNPLLTEIFLLGVISDLVNWRALIKQNYNTKLFSIYRRYYIDNIENMNNPQYAW